MPSPRNQPRDREAEAPADGPVALDRAPEQVAHAASEPPHPIGPRADAGLFALATIAGHYRIAADPFQLAHDLGLGARTARGEDLVRAARRIGLKSRLLQRQG